MLSNASTSAGRLPEYFVYFIGINGIFWCPTGLPDTEAFFIEKSDSDADVHMRHSESLLSSWRPSFWMAPHEVCLRHCPLGIGCHSQFPIPNLAGYISSLLRRT